MSMERVFWLSTNVPLPGAIAVQKAGDGSYTPSRRSPPPKFRVSGTSSSNRAWSALKRTSNEGSPLGFGDGDRKSTRLNSSHVRISYAVFCLKKKKKKKQL